MKVRRYKPTDYETLCQWMKERGTEFAQKSRLPRRGFIIEGIAAAFLCRTDIKTGIIEYFVANPQVSLGEKKSAYDLLFATIEDAAKKMGCEDLLAATDLVHVAGLAVAHGMTLLPTRYFVLKKPLKEQKEDGRAALSSESRGGLGGNPTNGGDSGGNGKAGDIIHPPERGREFWERIIRATETKS